LEYEDAIEFGISKRKLHIIPMGIDVEIRDERKTPAQESAELKILFVGRLARVRRVELILQAVSQLTIPYSLTIVGGEEKTSSLSKSGYLGELTKLAADLQISDKVHFAGRKAPEELEDYYQNADVFVYTSLYENFSQPILEAGAMGLPVIATHVGVAGEIVKDGETGFLLHGEPATICDRLMKMADPNLRKSMGETIRKVVQQHYSWDQVLQKYVDIYRSLVKN
jgi:D-inositol-3-phosphate glycosyltransferase